MTLAVDEDGLKLHVEQKYDGRRWGGVFPSQCVFVRVYVARGYCTDTYIAYASHIQQTAF